MVAFWLRVLLTLWVIVSIFVLLFGLTFGSVYQFYSGAIMLGLAVAAPSALRLTPSYRSHRFKAPDILAVGLLVAAVAVVVLCNQQLGSPNPVHPLYR